MYKSYSPPQQQQQGSRVCKKNKFKEIRPAFFCEPIISKKTIQYRFKQI